MLPASGPSLGPSLSLGSSTCGGCTFLCPCLGRPNSSISYIKSNIIGSHPSPGTKRTISLPSWSLSSFKLPETMWCCLTGFKQHLLFMPDSICKTITSVAGGLSWDCPQRAKNDAGGCLCSLHSCLCQQHRLTSLTWTLTPLCTYARNPSFFRSQSLIYTWALSWSLNWE